MNQKQLKNLHTDNSPVDQPQGSTRFVLNGINESERGDKHKNSNEEGNEVCYTLPDGHVPLGSEYTLNGNTVILSVSKINGSSEIGIADNDCNYTTIVNDIDSPEDKKLGFKLTHQIQITYRLRRGCEDTIYFTDKLSKPRYFNFGKIGQFKDGNGNWDANKFDLIRSYENIPRFESIEVLNSGGQLEPGGYNIAIQYLDEDLNPTEWIVTSDTIKIFNDDTTEEYVDIRGSINSDTDYIDFETTDKAIQVEFNNLDESFLFYRLAFIESTNGTGFVNQVRYTENIPISKEFFIYTGINFATEGTVEEIQQFTQPIGTTGHIEQIDNLLTLSEVTGKQANLCKLQKYASRIRTDMITKKVLLNTISDGNPKNPTVTMEAAGYMPGEIYSLGIVYVFEDGYVSPVYHIPGKNPNVDSNVVFKPGVNVHAMDNNNGSLNNLYIDNNTCENENYWGVDSEGDTLKNKPVRHHRFPLRNTINKDLVVEETSNTSSVNYYQVKLLGTGTIQPACSQENIDAGDCTVLNDAPPFQARVEFTVDGVTQFITANINPANQADPGDNPVSFAFQELSNLLTSNNVVITAIYESTDDGNFVDVTNGSTSPKGLSYTAQVQESEFTSETKLYSTDIFGLQFSNILLPPEEELNGEKIIGYYIVRNDRTESEKTILDSAILTPSVVNEKYVSHGLLAPEFPNTDKISKKIFGMINPEYKFKNTKYTQPTNIIQQGTFDVIERKKSKARYRDVLDGTSFDDDIHKGGGGNDEDGWSLKAITRDNILKYRKNFDFNKNQNDIEKIFHLKVLESRDVEEDTVSVYNIAADNRIAMLELKEDYNQPLNTLPYVYLTKDIADSYSTFRTLPYYKISNNFDDAETVSVFGGDTYVTPMRYVNTVFWDNRIAERAGRTSVWNYIIGAVLIVAAAILLVISAGTAAGITTLILASGISIIGGGALFIASGVRRDALVRAYNDEYDKGLRETALDDWVDVEYKNMRGTYEGNVRSADTPEDDELQWIADCTTDLWFESQINMSVRNGFSVDTVTHLNAPGKIEDGNYELEPIYEHFDVYKLRDDLIIPFTELDKHIMSKLAVFAPDRGDSRAYIGHPLGEYYNINPDYERRNKEKIYFHLGIEYDCCSECQEDFPQRTHYSQQSFQEELTDNYRVFLPNNYRDLEGEKGRITNVYRLGSNLYIHTEEALWHLPQNYQERVTNDIVSFIGTGSYFATPPRLIVDDEKSSAGTTHKWGCIKTKQGILFPSQIENKWYLFNGNDLKPISDYGNSYWFKDNMQSLVAQQYYASNKKKYPFLNNPSNQLGEGFISTYDTKKERFIITRKDFSLIDTIADNNDYELCINNNGDVTIFNDYQQTIDTYESNGWTFNGIKDCELQFSKIELVETEEEREITTTTIIPADTIVIPFFDTTSMDAATITNISNTIDSWFPGFKASVNGGDNNITLVNPGTWNQWSTEDWLEVPQLALSNVGANTDVLLLVFVDESNSPGTYHDGVFGTPMSAPTAGYISDVNQFVNVIYPQFASFTAINYPIQKDTDNNKNYLQHAIAAIEARSMTSTETNALTQNALFDNTQWNTVRTNLQNNPYVGQPILRNYGWLYKENRVDGIDNNGTAECPIDGVSVITPCQFTNDVEELLQNTVVTTTETITVTIQTPVTVYETVAGTPQLNIVKSNNSWTMSYDIEDEEWLSWHSYLPNFYFYIAEKFYSWEHSNNNIWKHNVKGLYQNYYGVRHPYILEYVVKGNDPRMTYIWDYIKLHTEALRYVEENKEYLDVDVTFNKLLAYNSKQISGILNLINKNSNTDLVVNLQPSDYLSEQVINTNESIIIDRNERDWTVNDLRDIRINRNQTMFNKSLDSRQDEYFIDKIINPLSIDFNKDWTQLESFRDKYLVIRLIFDNFDNIKLITNYSIEPETESKR